MCVCVCMYVWIVLKEKKYENKVDINLLLEQH